MFTVLNGYSNYGSTMWSNGKMYHRGTQRPFLSNAFKRRFGYLEYL